MTMNRVLLYALAVLGWFSFAFAQYGKVSGRVIDANTGEPLVAAAVYLDEIGMGTYTDENGYFVILRVPPGTYTLKAEYVGYVPYVLKNLVVEADRTKEVIIKMKPAEAAVKLKEEVVVAKEEVIKKDLTSSVSKIRSDKLQSLPIVSVEQAIQLQAGVQRVGGTIRIRGGRAGEVAYVVDGADMRDPYLNTGTPTLPLNAVAEVSVNKGGFGAEYGDASSGVIEVVTKEGTDKYEFQARVRSRRWGFLRNLYLGDIPLGASLVDNVLDANRGDRYAKWLSRRYLGTLYDEIYAYELARKSTYQGMNFQSDDPLFADMRYFYEGTYPFGETFYNQKNDQVRLELAASGPIVKKKLRFSGSIDYSADNGRFWRLDPNDGLPVPNRGYFGSYQLKLTAFPYSDATGKNLKVFLNLLGNSYHRIYWIPSYRLATSHWYYVKGGRYGYIAGANFLWSPKTYIELRVSNYTSRYYLNIFEDIDMDGIDDFADRDQDGYVEVDKDAINYVLNIGGNTYSYGCSEVINAINNDPDYVLSDNGEWVELRAFYWEMVGCYPNIDENISLVVGVTPQGDTVTVKRGAQDVVLKDTIFKFNNLAKPTPLTYYRAAHSWANRSKFDVKLDYVAQDFYNLKGHEVKAGFLFENIRMTQDDQDFASGGNVYPEPVDANPHKFAAYVRDKIEFEGMVANIGIRADYFDPNAYMPANLNMPVKDYLTINDVVASNSVWTWDQGLGIRRDTLNMRDPQRAKAVLYFSPRIGISHPISERDVLHFTYGHYFQIPRLLFLYRNNWWLFQGAYPIAPNPSLKPEKTISYEIGIRHAFNPYVFIDVTGFYKDIYDLIQSKVYDLYDVNNFGDTVRVGKWYSIFENADYASVRGFEVQFSKTFGGTFLPHLAVDINYTFQVARGSNSSPYSSYILTYTGIPPEYSQEYYLDWDQRHAVVLNIAWTNPLRNENIWRTGWGINLVYTYGTGYPYSPPLRNPRDVLERTNSYRYPGTQNADLNLYKLFKVMGSDLRLFLNIYNLFNDNEYLTYNNTDVYFQCLQDPRLCNYNPVEGVQGDVTVYNQRRTFEIGFQINWRQ